MADSKEPIKTAVNLIWKKIDITKPWLVVDRHSRYINDAVIVTSAESKQGAQQIAAQLQNKYWKMSSLAASWHVVDVVAKDSIVIRDSNAPVGCMTGDVVALPD